ncbi:hypothetical protein XELAEV_18003619mg [Xenopus laevis]|nr:hypothetical protein XELAEV_18003619mg [Xenopus laevis]
MVLPVPKCIFYKNYNETIHKSRARKHQFSETFGQGASSCLPKKLIEGIHVGQFLRLRRNCSKNKDFGWQARDMQKRFLERGYKQNIIQKAFQRAKGSDRKDLLKGNENRIRNQDWSEKVALTTRYKGQKQDLGPLASTGNYKCGSRRCITCNHMNVSKKFRSTVTVREFDIKGYINCNTPFVIYLITCLKCKKQYVGCTTRKMKERAREYESDKKSSNRIERVRLGVRGGDHLRLLERREVFWIFHLGILLPLGLNYEFVVTCYI